MTQETAGALQVIGAGLPRTGTTSLKAALEHLLGEPCYHMFELINAREAGMLWWQALLGDNDALASALDGYGAAIDWPASLFWRELRELHPQALVVLSHRADAATWWASVDKTVWAMMRRPDTDQAFGAFNVKMRERAELGSDWDVPEAAMARYDALYDDVVSAVPADQLIIWQASDGWHPLCAALDVDVPDIDFPYLNTTADFRERAELTDD